MLSDRSEAKTLRQALPGIVWPHAHLTFCGVCTHPTESLSSQTEHIEVTDASLQALPPTDTQSSSQATSIARLDAFIDRAVAPIEALVVETARRTHAREQISANTTSVLIRQAIHFHHNAAKAQRGGCAAPAVSVGFAQQCAAC